MAKNHCAKASTSRVLSFTDRIALFGSVLGGFSLLSSGAADCAMFNFSLVLHACFAESSIFALVGIVGEAAYSCFGFGCDGTFA